LNSEAWKNYIRLYYTYSSKLFLTIIISICQSFIILPVAWLIRHIFDYLIPAGNVYTVIITGMIIVILYILSCGIAIWTRYIILQTTKIIIQHYRGDLLKKFYAFSRSFYTQMDTSKLHTTIVQDTERLDIMTNAILALLIPALFTCFALSAVLIYLNWLLFLLLLTILPLIIWFSKFMVRKVKKKVHTFHQSFETFSKGMLFVLRMMDLTRIRSAESFEIDRQQKNIDDLRRKSGDMAWVRGVYVSFQDTLVAVISIIILIIGGRAITTGYMTLGELLSFYVVFSFVKSNLIIISSTIPQIIEGNESLNRIDSMLTVQDVRPYSGSKRIDFRGKISLDTVTFQYESRPVLQDISLIIQPGTTIAIIGPNGSGKTTLANLILGFYRPQKGQLFADDHSYKDLDMVELRKEIGVVTQNPVLFSGTIWENITYGTPDATHQQVLQASIMAHVHNYIQDLPRGYDTLLGEDGVRFSGGQRQRIAIARAFLCNPRFLILDEPFNHLDEAAVLHLMDHFKKSPQRPTMIIISHNKQVGRIANHIYILSEGCIKTSGDPITLLHNNTNFNE